MSREDIVNKLREYIAEGKILCKSRNGKYYHGFNRGISKKEFFATPYESLVTTDLEIAEWIVKMTDDKRIMTFRPVQCKYRELVNEHLVHKACMRGEMIKFDDFGRGCVLYID